MRKKKKALSFYTVGDSDANWVKCYGRCGWEFKAKPQVLLEQEQKIRAKARRFDGLLYFVRVFYRELSFLKTFLLQLNILTTVKLVLHTVIRSKQSDIVIHLEDPAVYLGNTESGTFISLDFHLSSRSPVLQSTVTVSDTVTVKTVTDTLFRRTKVESSRGLSCGPIKR